MARTKNPNIAVTEVRIFLLDKPVGNLLASANVCINDSMIITGVKIMKGKGGVWVAFPSIGYKSGRETKYKDVVYFLDKETNEEVSDSIIEAYEDAIKW